MTRSPLSHIHPTPDESSFSADSPVTDKSEIVEV